MGPQTPAVPVQNWVQKRNWQSCWLHVQTPCLIRDRTQHKGIQSSRRVCQFHGTAGNTKGYDTKRNKNRDKKDAVLRQVCSHIRNNTFHKNARDLLFTDTLKHRGSRIVVPSTLEQRVLQLAHESHQGVAKTKSLLREKVWFLNIDRKVKAIITNCIVCQANTSVTHVEPLQMSELPEAPWHNLSADFYGPLPTGEYLLVIIDDYTRYPVVNILHTTSTTAVIPVLDDVFSMCNPPGPHTATTRRSGSRTRDSGAGGGRSNK